MEGGAGGMWPTRVRQEMRESWAEEMVKVLSRPEKVFMPKMRHFYDTFMPNLFLL